MESGGGDVKCGRHALLTDRVGQEDVQQVVGPSRLYYHSILPWKETAILALCNNYGEMRGNTQFKLFCHSCMNQN